LFYKVLQDIYILIFCTEIENTFIN